jgi:endonuclease I
MKKNIILLTFLLCSLIGMAQIPANYYATATGTGLTLKTQLRKIIDNVNDGLSSEHIAFDQGYAGLYITYTTSDIDSYYENDGTMLDMYTENPTGPECAFTYGTNQDNGTGGSVECDKYNREHIIPQSAFSSATPMYSDAHFVVPSDKYVNAQRGDLPFGVVATASNTYSNGSKKGNNLNSGYSSGYSSTVFEPINEFKGDIARMLLYFGTRYETQVIGFTFSMFNGTSDQVYTNTFLNILLKWHLNDPVSQREIDRNNAVYARQNNRNPYIDHPEYLCQIFPTQCATLTSENFVLENSISIYPNPVINNEVTISSEKELESIIFYNINGQIIQEIKNPVRVDNSYKVTNLSSGFYLVQLASEKALATKKIIVN